MPKFSNPVASDYVSGVILKQKLWHFGSNRYGCPAGETGRERPRTAGPFIIQYRVNIERNNQPPQIYGVFAVAKGDLERRHSKLFSFSQAQPITS